MRLREEWVAVEEERKRIEGVEECWAEMLRREEVRMEEEEARRKDEADRLAEECARTDGEAAFLDLVFDAGLGLMAVDTLCLRGVGMCVGFAVVWVAPLKL